MAWCSTKYQRHFIDGLLSLSRSLLSLLTRLRCSHSMYFEGGLGFGFTRKRTSKGRNSTKTLEDTLSGREGGSQLGGGWAEKRGGHGTKHSNTGFTGGRRAGKVTLPAAHVVAGDKSSGIVSGRTHFGFWVRHQHSLTCKRRWGAVSPFIERDG